MERTMPMQVGWDEWYPMPILETKREVTEQYSFLKGKELQEQLDSVKFIEVPLKLAGKYYKLLSLRTEILREMNELQAANQKEES